MMTNTLMAAGNFGSPMQLIILLIIVVVLFGSRLPNIGSQIGGAIKGFKKSMSSEDDEEKKADAEKLKHDDLKIIEGAVEKEKEKEQHK